jgi:hypothetical protein
MAYTTIDDPSAYFQTALYTGNSGDNAITNDGNSDLQPDWIWVKNRGATQDHVVFDSSRGFNGDNDSLYLETNNSDAESHNDNDHLKSFNSDGFTMQGGSGRSNNNTVNFVAWQWKANGGTTTSQTGADINSVTQASTTAGFSIVTYTGDGNTSQTVKHGLGGVPEAIIMKNRERSSQWESYFAPVGNSHIMELSTNAAKQDTDNFGNTDPTSTVFTVDSGANNANASGEDIVAYCFRSIQGYSKIGSYKGNGNADGAFVYTGFKPAWVIVKLSSGSGEDWHIFDSKRSTSNVVKERLIANGNAAENANDSILDFLSNGFKFRENNAGWNGSNNTYIYMAFAEQPFVSSEGVPTTAR